MQVFSSCKEVLIISFALILSNGCSKSEDEISYDLIGNWKVIYYINGDEKITKTQDNTWPDINNGDITANFTEPDDNEGTISGITVSNQYSGSYTLGERGQIAIGPISTTLINEPEWTDLFHISATNTYEIKDSQLFLYTGDRENTIVFDRN